MKIITDTSYLISPIDGEKIGVKVLPVTVTINGLTYRDYLDISTHHFFDMINLGFTPTFITTFILVLFLIFRHRRNILRLKECNENKIKWM